MVLALPSRETHEQGRKVVCSDTGGSMCDRCVRMPLVAVRIRGPIGGAVSAGDTGANLREYIDLPDLRHNIPSDDTAEPIRDDRDGQGGSGVPHRPRPGPPRHGNRP